MQPVCPSNLLLIRGNFKSAAAFAGRMFYKYCEIGRAVYYRELRNMRCMSVEYTPEVE